MRLYPQATSNPNVPAGVFLVAETYAMSHEITTTYYIDRDGGMWKVGDWKGDKPHACYMSEMADLTGDTERTLYGRLSSWVRSQMAEAGQ